MAKKLQLRRGTTSQHSSFTGAVGEVTVDTDKDVLVVHDGSTAGGHASVKSGAIATADIADGAITAAKIADGTVVEAEIANNAVTTAKINADAVTGAKIADNAVGNEHLEDDAVGVAELSATGTASSSTFLRGDNAWAVVDTTNASNLSTGTLPIARIADGAVTSAKISDATIVSGDLADNAVTTAKITNSAVTSAKIADGTIIGGDIGSATITGGNLVNSTITTTQIANDAITNAKLGVDCVTQAEIADDSIYTVHIVDGSCTTATLATNAVTNVKVADDAIGVAELSASGTANSTSFLRGDNTWAVPGGGKLKQIQFSEKTTIQSVSPGSGSYSSVSGMSVSITPASTSNKILISGHMCAMNPGDHSGRGVVHRILRGSTVIGVGTSVGSRTACNAGNAQAYNHVSPTHPFNYLDSPSTTSAITYYIQVSPMVSGTAYINYSSSNENQADRARTISCVWAMEIEP